MKKTRKIIAIIRKEKGVSIGFCFNTEIQSYVENFMVSIHQNKYVLWFEDELKKPYYVTNVKVKVKLNPDGSTKNVDYLI
jgi:hypothetical protein